jgi:ribosomal protein S18 acetylase RimI-like enzyme
LKDGVHHALRLNPVGEAGSARALLQDAVDSGASVGFLPPLSGEDASDYWHSVLRDLDAAHRLLLGAMDRARLVGSVQLELAWKPNAVHRAEVQRLLVLRSARRRGIGERLMRQLEELARQRGRTLLVLDTRQGDPSELLYQKIGYTRVGVIPGYARSSNGSLDTTAVYFRQLDPLPGARADFLEDAPGADQLMSHSTPNAIVAEWRDAPIFGSAPPDEPATVRPSAYGLVIDPANRLAVVRTPQGLFLPGGGIEPGESPRAAVVREVLEECGLEVCIGAWSVRAVDFVYSPTEQTHFEKRSTFLDAHPSGHASPPAKRITSSNGCRRGPPGQPRASSHRWAVEQWLDRSGATATSR